MKKLIKNVIISVLMVVVTIILTKNLSFTQAMGILMIPLALSSYLIMNTYEKYVDRNYKKRFQ